MTCPPVLQLPLQQMQEQGQILLEGTPFCSTSRHQNLEISVDYHKQPDQSILLTKTAQGHSVYKPLTLKQLSYSHMYMPIHHFQHTHPSFSSGQTCSLLKAWLRFGFPPFLAELLHHFLLPLLFLYFLPHVHMPPSLLNTREHSDSPFPVTEQQEPSQNQDMASCNGSYICSGPFDGQI